MRYLMNVCTQAIELYEKPRVQWNAGQVSHVHTCYYNTSICDAYTLYIYMSLESMPMGSGERESVQLGSRNIREN